METHRAKPHHVTWNKEKLVGQKAPLKLKENWAICVRLQMQQRHRELALFNLGIDSKLRACDLVRLRVRDIRHGDSVAARAIVLQQKTRRPVQFEITPSTREAIEAWIKHAGLKSENFLFPSRRRLDSRRSARNGPSWNTLHTRPLSDGRWLYRAATSSMVCRCSRRFSHRLSRGRVWRCGEGRRFLLRSR